MRTVKQSLIVAAALTLAACAQTPPPAINDKVVTVKVPVAIPCVDRSKIPAPVAAAQINGDAVHDVSVLARTDLALRSAVDQLMALVGPCTMVPASEINSGGAPASQVASSVSRRQ